MVDTILRGVPYYFVFILLFVLYRKYKRVLSYAGECETNPLSYNCETDIPLSTEATDRSRKQLLKFAYLILVIFLGLRGYVYTDFVNYKPFFDLLEGFQNLPEVLLIKGWEPGFVVYSALCKLLVPNYFAWNVISTIIDLFLLYKILERYSNNHILSLIVFFIIGATALEFNVLRNAKAIFLFLYALRYIEEKKKWKYFGVIFIACLFHISSIMYFPLYFVLNKKWPKWILWSIYIGGALIMFLHIGIISDIVSRISFSEDGRLEHLAGHLENSQAYSSLFGNIERMITMFIVIILYNKLAESKNCNLLFLNMYVLLYAAFTVCSESAVMVQRFQYMFIASFWVLYPMLIEYAKENRNKTIYLFIVALLSMKLVLIASDPNLEYENVLTGVSDFDTRAYYTEKNLGK